MMINLTNIAESKFLSSVSTRADYKAHVFAENTRRTKLFAKFVITLVTVLIAIMIYNYDGADLTHFLLTEPYSQIFFSYIIVSILVLALCHFSIHVATSIVLYRIAIIALCAQQAALDVALYNSMVIYQLAAICIAVLVSQRLPSLLLFFSGAGLWFAFLLQRHVDAFLFNHYLQIFVMTLLCCVIAIEFERQRRKSFKLTVTLQQQYQKAEQASRTDYLTGIYNRKAIFELGYSLCANANRHHQPISVICLDIDKFKSINDNYGHAAGDKVIISLANLCSTFLRAGDSLGRVGGEEFIVILPNTELDNAKLLTDRLLELIRNETIEFNSNTINITSSAGVAQCNRDNESFENLLIRADEALYRAKNAGRDRLST